MSEHFNQLLPDQAEALALLAEECGEVIQVIGKILRHGLHSRHPSGGPDNYDLLEREIGDIQAAIYVAINVGVVDVNNVDAYRVSKLRRVREYLHHVNLPPDAPAEKWREGK